jgi:hypothetical protein
MRDMRRLAMAGVVVAVSTVIASPAFAQTLGSATVAPESGGVLRGIPSAAPATPAPPERVLVHMTGSPDATLETRSGSGWALVCTSPCDTWLPIHGDYRTAGPHMRPSRVFALEGTVGTTDYLYVDAASSSAYVAGGVAASVGYGASVVGLVIVIISAVTTSTCALVGGGPCSWTADGLLVPGASAILIGAVVGTVGVVANRSNAQTSIVQTPNAADRAQSSALSVRLPIWRDTAVPARDLVPAPVAVPLYTLTF